MKKRIFLFIISFLIIGILIVKVTSNANAKRKNNNEVKVEKEINKKEIKIEKIKVDIKGNILNPGVYEVDVNSRVIDVVSLAGGITDNADTSSINLSKILKDEDVIIIYEKGKDIKTYEEYQESIELCNKDNNDVCIEKMEANNTENNSIININEANKELLMTLTGIGESKAVKIIEYREKEGKFNTIEDIKNVEGIGDSLFEKIKNYITI